MRLSVCFAGEREGRVVSLACDGNRRDEEAPQQIDVGRSDIGDRAGVVSGHAKQRASEDAPTRDRFMG